MSLGLALPAAAAAQGAPGGIRPNFVVDRWTTEDGLPSHYIHDLAQTDDRYLWLIASQSVVRFDGVRFEVFPELAAGGRPWALLPTHGDSMMVLSVSDTGSSVMLHTAERDTLLAQGSTTWRRLARTRAEGLWIATTDRLLPQAGSAPGLPYGGGWDGRPMYTDVAGRLWISDVARDSLGIVEPGGVRYVAPIIREPLVARPSTGTVLIPRLRGGRLVLEDVEGAVAATLPDRPDLTPRLVDREGRVWATAEAGVEVYAPGGELLAALEVPPSGPDQAFVEGREGGIWIPTATGGLFRAREVPFTVIGRAQGFGGAQVTIAAPARGGELLAVDDGLGAYRVRGEQVTPLPSRDPPLAIRTVLQDRSGTIWLASTWMDRMWLVGLRPDGSALDVPAPIRPYTMAEDPRHPGVFWAADSDLYLLRPYDPSAQPERWELGSEAVRSIAFDEAGGVWVTAARGLAHLVDGRLEWITGEGYPGRPARGLLIDADGTVWIGSHGLGLTRFRDGRFQSVRAADGLAEDVVSSILEDAEGNFWMGGDRSIHRVARADLEAFLTASASRVRGVAYDGRHGLSNPEGSGWAAVRDPGGRMWFPTFGGLATVDPARALALDSAPPLVRITSVTTAEGRLPSTPGGLRLGPGQRRIEVAFTALSMRDPAGVRFEYRLDGLDDAWVDAGPARTATFTSLGPGAYAFRLRAVSGAGVSSREDAVLTFSIAPRFHETGAFLLLALTALVGLVAAGWRLRIRRLLARETELSALVAGRTAALQEQTRMAREALRTVASQSQRLRAVDEAKSRFFANISHELRTPLTLILGPLRDLRRGQMGAVGEDAARELDQMLETGDRLQELVTQMLDLALLEDGNPSLQIAIDDGAAFTARIGRRFEPHARSKGIGFAVRLPGGPVPLPFDRDRLDTVLTNLLGNAFKFTDAGGSVVLGARVAEDGWFVVSVEDDGPGIPPDAIDRVFERFYQVDSSAQRRHGGAGVGLALARDLVELHGGHLTVRSEPGAGARFEVWLPGVTVVPTAGAAPDAVEAQPGAAAPPAAISGDEDSDTNQSDETTVLLVEDNPGVRSYLRRHLAGAYRVVEAENGLEGLEVARRVVPDLIVSDVMMPELDGEGFCTAVRADPDLDFIPFIMLTARASHGHLIDGLRLGADDYLTKPVDVEELLLRIHNQIAQRRRFRERMAAELSAAGPVPPSWSKGAGSDPFAEKLRRVLEERVGDEDLNVDALARALGVSRSSLYRHVEAATGQAPMDVVWSYRLEQAALWLHRTDANVAEIAYGVGFKSVPHFCRRFLERYGQTPSAYRSDGLAHRPGAP